MRQAGDNATVWEGKRGGLCVPILSYLSEDYGLVQGGEDGSVCSRAGSRYSVTGGVAWSPALSRGIYVCQIGRRSNYVCLWPGHA